MRLEVYRFYHQSYKVHALQEATNAIVAALQALAPERKLNDWFMQTVKDGTGKTFEQAHNRRWLEVTRPIVEACFHARYFLEMGVRYGKELALEAPPRTMPSGWAAFLYLYERVGPDPRRQRAYPRPLGSPCHRSDRVAGVLAWPRWP